MRHLGTLATIALVAMAGCENTSRLDKTVRTMDRTDDRPAASPVAGDHSGTVEERLARLETMYAKYAEPLEFLAKVYDQQKQQQKAQQREEPDPDAMFAVDIASNVKLGMVEGPSQALVTIVEAWDFA